MRRFMSATAFFLLLPISAHAYNCGEILQFGLWENTKYARSADQSEEFRNWWCNKKTQQSGSSKDTSYNLEGSYGAAQGEFNSAESKQNYAHFKSVACGKQYSSKELQEDVSLYTNRASSEVVKAWSLCTRLGNDGQRELHGVRAWVDFPNDPAKTKLVSLQFAFRSPAEGINSANVTITSLKNLQCEGISSFPATFSVSDPPSRQFTCERQSDAEAAINFKVAAVESNPNGLIYLNPVEREPRRTPFVADLKRAQCNPTDHQATWSVKESAITVRSGKTAARTSSYRCTWELPGFRAKRATLTIDGFTWDSGSQHDGSGGAHNIYLLDQNSQRGGEAEWAKQAKGKSKQNIGHQIIAAEFAAPTSTIAIELVMRHSWKQHPITWTTENPVLSVSTDDQVLK